MTRASVPPSTVATSSNGLFLVPGPVSLPDNGCGSDAINAVAAAIHEIRPAWDFLDGLPDVARVPHPEAASTSYAQRVVQADKPVIFMALRSADDVAAAYAMAEVTTVVARLHCAPSEASIRDRLRVLSPDGARQFDTLYRGIVAEPIEGSA